MAEALGRYLWHSNPGVHVSPIGAWANFFDVGRVDAWYDKLVSSDLAASTVFNSLTALSLGSDYAYAKLGMTVPNGFNNHIARLKSKERRKRKVDEQILFERQSVNGVPNLQPFIDAIKCKDYSQRISSIFDTAVEILKGNTNRKIIKRDFLFSMRLVLAYVTCSMGLRASAIYTLKMKDVTGEDFIGFRDGETAILFRNKDFHKTYASHGQTRIVLSGQGKTFFLMYIAAIRKVYVRSEGFSACGNVFLDGSGKELSASAVNRHLKSIVANKELPVHYSTTYIRKCIRSQLAMESSQQTQKTYEDAIAAGLLHSAQVSNRHYSLGRRDRVALNLHDSIVARYEL